LLACESAADRQTSSLPQPPAASDTAAAPPKSDEPVTIERAAQEFLADIEARKMDDSTRRKYRTMLKQLRKYADESGFLYLSQL
jgi:hypothetical protein